MRRVMTLLPSLSAIFVGSASFAVSYNTLRLEAVTVGAVADGWASYLLPLMLDGAVLSGSAVLWKASLDGSRRPVFPNLFVAALVALSVVVNVAHAGPTLLARVIASLPPLVLLGCLELVVISHRSSRGDLPKAKPRGQHEHTEHDQRAPAEVFATPAVAVTAPAITPKQPATPAGYRTSTETSVAGEAPKTAQSAQAVPAGPTPSAVEAPVPAAAAAVATGSRDAARLAAVRDVPTPVAQSSNLAAATPSGPETRTAPASRSVQPTQAAPSGPADPTAPTASGTSTTSTTSTRSGRALRIAAEAPAPVGAADGVTDTDTAAGQMLAADRVRALFEQHVDGGGNPHDPTLTATLATQADVSQAYVRKVIKPLRDALVSA